MDDTPLSAATGVPRPGLPRPGAPATLFVCVTCRLAPDETEPRAGRRMHDAMVAAHQRHPDAARLAVVPVECLSNCNRACTVAFAGPGRWTYVHGDLAPEAADDVVAGAILYAGTDDGLVPWRQRPERLRKGVISRVPPLPEHGTSPSPHPRGEGRGEGQPGATVSPPHPAPVLSARGPTSPRPRGEEAT